MYWRLTTSGTRLGIAVFGCSALLAVVAYGFARWVPVGRLGLWPGSAVAFGSKHFDFGRVAADTTLKHSFSFTNTGGQTINIARLRSSCGCITDDTVRLPVNPGESGFVAVRLNTKGIKPPSHLHKQVIVHFDSKDISPVCLSLAGDVVPDVVVEPACITFPKAPFDGATAQVLVIRNEMMSAQAFAGIEVAVSEPYYRVLELKRNEREIWVEVSLLPAVAPVGLAPLQVKYEKDGRFEAISVPVTWEGMSQIELVPSSYVVTVDRSMAAETLSAATKRPFVLKSAAHADVRVTSISVWPPGKEVIAWEITENGSQSHFSVWVKQAPDDERVYSAFLRLGVMDCRTKMDSYINLSARVLVVDSSGSAKPERESTVASR